MKKASKIGEMLYVTSREEWRKWLAEHHGDRKEIWLIYYRDGKHPSLSYDDRLREAICFGWVDTILKLVGRKKYASRFVPRRRKSRWSIRNRILALEMLREGKMTPSGMAVLPTGVLSVWKNRDLHQEPINLLLEVANEKRRKILDILRTRDMSLSQIGEALPTGYGRAGLMRDHMNPLLEAKLVTTYADPQDSLKNIFRITDLGIEIHDLLNQLIS